MSWIASCFIGISLQLRPTDVPCVWLRIKLKPVIIRLRSYSEIGILGVEPCTIYGLYLEVHVCVWYVCKEVYGVVSYQYEFYNYFLLTCEHTITC